jgi:hypothetical protein
MSLSPKARGRDWLQSRACFLIHFMLSAKKNHETLSLAIFFKAAGHESYCVSRRKRSPDLVVAAGWRSTKAVDEIYSWPSL